ncbi:MAG: hypothetical protein KAT01_09250 [Candidatus Aminicenantes bacterium]|nr:hypothetical protein [Candidatus Aminicenantes bacterium]
MQKPRFPIIFASLILFSLGLSYFVTLHSQASSFTILNHEYRFLPAFFLVFLLLFFLLASIWLFLTHVEVKNYGSERSASLWDNVLPYLPLSFFLLTPLILNYYLDRGDLKIRLNVFMFAVLFCFLYLFLLHWDRFLNIRSTINKALQSFSHLPPRKKLVILFLAAFLIYNLCTFVLVSQKITFSGDEPYYLLTSHSLLKDKDINVANNYAQEDYFSFYSKEKNPRFRLGMYAREGQKGRNYIYPINLPGVSVLVLPSYWLSQHFHGDLLTFILKGSLVIWAVLLGLQLYLLARELWGDEKIALQLWLFYSFSAPVLFFAIHLYSEIPIALFSLYIFRKVRSKKPPTLFHYFFLGFLLSLFFWFGLKYNLLFGTLLLVSMYFLLKAHRAGVKILCFLLFPLLSLTLFYTFIHSIYGTFSPFSVYEGMLTPERLQAFKDAALSAPLSMRFDTLLNYFLDQRDGLLLYSPFYVFAFLGFVEIFRRSKRDFFILLFIPAPYLLNYAFFTHRQGYSPQGRILTPISWILALAVGYFLVTNRKKLYTFLFWFLSYMGIVFALFLLRHPHSLYQPTTSEFTSRAGEMFVHLSNMYIFLPHFLPSFIKVNNIGYLPNYLWVLAIVIFVCAYAFIKREMCLKRTFYYVFALSLLLLAFLLWVLFPRPSLYDTRTFRYSPQVALGYYLFPMGDGVVVKKTAEFYLHRENNYRILLSSRRARENLQLNFGSEKGEYEVRLNFFDLPLFEGKTTYEKKEITLNPSVYYPYKNLYLYEIHLNLTQLSSESMLVEPFFFQIVPIR